MPADIEFKLEGIEELIAKTGNVNVQIGPIVRELLDKSLFAIEAKAKHNAPVGDTGLLRASLTKGHEANIHEIGAGYIPMWGQVGTKVIYARMREHGGTIRAKNKPYLVFKTRDGRWHSVKEVTQKGTHYLYRGMEDAYARIMDNLEDAKRKIEDAFR